MIRVFLGGLVAACALSAAWAGDDPSGKTPALKATTIQGELKADDPKDRVRKNSPHKTHPLELKAGQTVVIRMKTGKFDAFLRIEDSEQRQLAFNDDDGESLNSKIVFKAKKDGTFTIIATALNGGEGAYTLTIEPASLALLDLDAIKGDLQKRQQQLTMAYQKAGEEEKEKIVAQFNNLIPEIADRLVKLAGDHPKDPAAEQALTMVLTAPGKGPNFDKALSRAGDLLIRDHLQAKNNPLALQRILMGMSQARSPAAADVLRTIVVKAPTELIKGQGNLALGVNLRSQYEEAFTKKDATLSKKLAAEA